MSRISKMMVVALIALGAVVLTTETGNAYSYGAWVGMTGANTIAWNPFLSGSLDGESLTDWENLVEFGVSDYADIFLSLSADPWGMVRYDLSKGNNVGIVGLYLDSGSAGLQYHMITALADIFTLEANVSVSVPYMGADSFGNMSFGAIIAPVLTFTEKMAFYCEIDPSFTLGEEGGFDLTLVPGLWFSLGNGELSVGFPIGGLTGGDVSVSYGAWYWIPFSCGE